MNIFLLLFIISKALIVYFFLTMINSDILYGKVFSLLQVLLSIIIAVVFLYLYKLIRIRLEGNILERISISSEERKEQDKRNLSNITLIIILSFLTATFSLIKINEGNNNEVLGTEVYYVHSKGKRYFITHSNDYILITNKETLEKRRHFVSNNNNYDISQKLMFVTFKGSLGFDYIEEINYNDYEKLINKAYF